VKFLQCSTLMIVVTAFALASAGAAERKSDDGPQWPTVRVDDADFPSQPLNTHPSFTDPDEVTDRILGRTSHAARQSPGSASKAGSDVTGSTARWPNVHVDDDAAPPRRPNPRPSFTDPDEVTERIMGRPPRSAAKPTAQPSKPSLASNPLATDVTGSTARWPVEREPPRSPFALEAGARYWYSIGSIKFNFTNNDPLFGSPTSTLFWHGMVAQSGEAFARIDHLPSGFFVKGMVGMGRLSDGNIVDEDFLVTQFKFSDTTSDVNTGSTHFAMFDVGWAYWPVPDVRLGVFAGYHYWHDEMTAFGLVCNQASVLGCPAAGAVLFGDNVAGLRYEPTWNAVRIGADAKVIIGQGWSVSGEFALVPYAYLVNKDSHLLRQDFSDLGPAPNVITKSTYAFGAEAEVFVNYAVTSNIEIGAGLRYWGLEAVHGGVRFGPLFTERDTLDSFSQQRYGLLAHVKGTF
jgi:hypothetical protein